jgi:hypothetical protein
VYYNCEDDEDPNEEQDRNEGIRLGMVSKKTYGNDRNINVYEL